MSKYLLVFLLILAARGLLAEDFKTLDGNEYKNVTVSRVEPDGIVLKTNAGTAKVYFVELSKADQERFHYNPAPASANSAQQAVNQPTPALGGRGQQGEYDNGKILVSMACPGFYILCLCAGFSVLSKSHKLHCTKPLRGSSVN